MMMFFNEKLTCEGSEGGPGVQVDCDLVIAVVYCLVMQPPAPPQLCQEVVMRLLQPLLAALQSTLSVSKDGPSHLVFQAMQDTIRPMHRLVVLMQAVSHHPAFYLAENTRMLTVKTNCVVALGASWAIVY